MTQPDLQRVLQRAQQADAEALSTLVDRYGPRVFGLLYRLTGSRDAAEDLLQDTFMRLVRRLGDYEDRGRFEAWLFRIAANLARDYVRRKRRRGVMTSLPSDADDADDPALAAAEGQDDPQSRLTGDEESRRLGHALGLLSPPEQEILMLRHYSDMSFKEIAELLGVPLGTALARAHRALNRLRKLLEPQQPAGVKEEP